MQQASRAQPEPLRFGLRANCWQFALLVLITAFVGGMVGLERALLPLMGKELFGLGAGVVAFSFVVAFGVVKALTNVASGVLADRRGRKAVLVGGWLVGLPVPFMLAWGPTWAWVVAANLLLGVSQGLAWSMTVNMKIDLVGPRQRGLAMGLNEAAGYGALGLTALLSATLAAQFGLRPAPFYIGMVYAVLGLALSVLVVRDTRPYAQHEAAFGPGRAAERPSSPWVAAETSWRNRTLFAVSQAGLVNNLNDGVAWTVFPLLFASYGVGLAGIGLIAALYPLVWGLGQIVTGVLADRWGRKPLIVSGMLSQALGLAVIGLGPARPLVSGVLGALLLGVGTAMAYPALLAVVGDEAQPAWRATALGVYRFWRDSGYAIGALLAGLAAQLWGLAWAVYLAGLLTLVSSLLSWRFMRETLPRG